MSTPKKYYATRDFNDAGTGRSFVADGKPFEVTEGEARNWLHAGLLTEKQPEQPKPAA